MAELKDLLPLSKSLSLLYIDENEEFLRTITAGLSKVFARVDDAQNATIALGYLKVNSYDLIIVDSDSEIMSVENFVQNTRKLYPYQDIIITTPTTSQEKIISYYQLGISSLHKKPFKTASFLEAIQTTLAKQQNERAFLQEKVEKLNSDLQYERKRIGRFMLNEKKLLKQIEMYKESVHVNKYIYELTRLPSRYALQDALGESEQSVIYLNIDHFDFVNTTYGMGKANKLLKETANKLKIFLPTNATLYHITADEYVILLDNPVSDQAYQLATQIQSLFKESAVDFDGYSQFVVFSMGIDTGVGTKLFINAKAASKEARYFGGNQIVLFNVYSEYMKEQRESRYWINILQKAFDEDKIFTYYQPIISNSTTQTKHYEVLCRLMDDENRLVNADKFIKSAKQVGLIVQITKTVIDKTFKLFANNQYNFSINISMHDLHENYLLSFLEYKCEKYSISPSRVHLEIVEDIIIAQSVEVDKQIAGLKNKGFHVIIDDFGTDKSAYNRMFDLQAEYIKIDGTFIKELDKHSEHKLIIQSIVDFAKKSGIKTIAEHVENEETYEIVKSLGVDYSQGYYVGKPSINLE